MAYNEQKLTKLGALKALAQRMDTRLDTVETAAGNAIKSVNVSGNTVGFYKTTDHSGTAAFTVDFPAELFLDQTKTVFVDKFKWAEATYPGSTNPSMEGKPVFVLAVKGANDSVTYSFVNMATLVDTYTAKVTGKDASTSITISGYEVEVAVNISSDSGNILEKRDDGLYVPTPAATDISGKADKVSGATNGHLAGLDANGNLTDSGKAASDFVEKVLVDGVEDAVVHQSDIATDAEVTEMLNEVFGTTEA